MSSISPETSRIESRMSEKKPLRPVTVRQLLEANQIHSNADFTIDGHPISAVTTVVNVVSLDSSNDRRNMFQFEDGSRGRLHASQWDADILGTNDDPDGLFGIREGTYVRVVGTLSRYGNPPRNSLNIRGIRPVTDPHEIYYHMLEVIYTTLYHDRGPPPQNIQPAIATQQSSSYGTSQAPPSTQSLELQADWDATHTPCTPPTTDRSPPSASPELPASHLQTQSPSSSQHSQPSSISPAPDIEARESPPPSDDEVEYLSAEDSRTADDSDAQSEVECCPNCVDKHHHRGDHESEHDAEQSVQYASQNGSTGSDRSLSPLLESSTSRLATLSTWDDEDALSSTPYPGGPGRPGPSRQQEINRDSYVRRATVHDSANLSEHPQSPALDHSTAPLASLSRWDDDEAIGSTPHPAGPSHPPPSQRSPPRQQVLSRDPYSHLSTLNRSIMLEIMHASKGSVGAHIQVVTNALLGQGVWTKPQINNGFEFLFDEGYVYTTIDDNHYQVV
ncbi:hypothetical protein JAAARDRAFT_31954 [Jaapia argillacea MUCL 33604]|uniref:Replication protein A C-terminal domain-containing protein n=1 Tax=Jaapia argillacea MUCL 33604 TaxID=933084 RepID=A0A067QBV2_9AGAM|nr:hypothetical protein JAAARDRAFT_31954 [Jaapia argillacea MUCL 33604]